MVWRWQILWARLTPKTGLTQCRAYSPGWPSAPSSSLESLGQLRWAKAMCICNPWPIPQTHDALCMLPINVVNEKIYVFLWFWLLFLTLITSLFLVFRLTIVFNTPFLRNLIKRKLRHRFLEDLSLWNTLRREGAADVLDDVTHKFQMVSFYLWYLSLTNIFFIQFPLSLSLISRKLVNT